MTDSNIIQTDTAPPPVGAYPHARRVGDLLFLSGVGPRRPGSGEIPGNVMSEEGELLASGYPKTHDGRTLFALITPRDKDDSHATQKPEKGHRDHSLVSLLAERVVGRLGVENQWRVAWGALLAGYM